MDFAAADAACVHEEHRCAEAAAGAVATNLWAEVLSKDVWAVAAEVRHRGVAVAACARIGVVKNVCLCFGACAHLPSPPLFFYGVLWPAFLLPLFNTTTTIATPRCFASPSTTAPPRSTAAPHSNDTVCPF